MSGKKIGFGLLIGTAVGLAIAYFSNSRRREEFCESVGDLSDRAQDNLIDAYNKAKDKYNSYRRKIKGTTEELLQEAEQELDELAD